MPLFAGLASSLPFLILLLDLVQLFAQVLNLCVIVLKDLSNVLANRL